MKKTIKDKNGNIVGYSIKDDNSGILDYKEYVDNLVNEIRSNTNELFNNTFNIGTVIINNVSTNFNPGFGTWELIGDLSNGKTIVGSTEKDIHSGNMINHTHKIDNHNHKWQFGFMRNKFQINYADEYAYLSFHSFDSEGNTRWTANAHTNNYNDSSKSDGTYTDKDAYTNNISLTTNGNNSNNSYNKVYGLGVGNKYVWIRKK